VDTGHLSVYFCKAGALLSGVTLFTLMLSSMAPRKSIIGLENTMSAHESNESWQLSLFLHSLYAIINFPS